MSLPLTPVVGYVRAETPAEAAGLGAVLDQYAVGAGLVVCHVHRESNGATGASLPAFAACLARVRSGTARGIVLPSWAHLAPNGLLGAALLRDVDRVGGLVYVADVTSVPDWAPWTPRAVAVAREVRAYAQVTVWKQS